MSKAIVTLANGFEDIEAVAVVDILRRGGVEVVTASIHDSPEVTSAHGIVMKADILLSSVRDDDEFDAVILPGGGEGTQNLEDSSAVHELLHRQKERNGYICAICAAPTVLVGAGVLDEGQQVTCYPTCQMELDRPWVDQPVVVHDNVITGKAPGAATLFGLVILQHLEQDSTAQRVARGMVTEF